MNYGDLLKDSLRITLRNRFLWFFGLFAGAGGGSLGVPSNSGGTFPQEADKSMPSVGTLVEPARQWVAENLFAVSLAVGLVLLVTLVFVAVGALCAGALAESVAAIDRGVGRRFVSTFNAALSVFPRALGLVLIFSVLYGLLLLIAGGSMLFLFLGSSPGSLPSQIVSVIDALTLASLLVFVVFIPLGIVGQFALREAVVRGERVFTSIRNSYLLFRRNLGKSLLLWFIQVVVGVAASILFVIILLIVGLLLGLPAVLLLALAGKSVGIGAFVVAGAVFVFIGIVLAAAIGTFNHAYWTLAYLRLTAPPIPEPG
jgi:hypothetical protein